MAIRQVIKSQYQASLTMFEEAISKCPAELWADPAHQNKFWHVAYHALFYTHLYLQPSEADFRAWAKHRADHHIMGPLPWPPHTVPEIGKPYTKVELLEYVAICRQQVEEQLAVLDLEATASGFAWLPFGKLELQFYNIRHLMLHTGELCERLWAAAGIEVGWTGMQAVDG